MTCWRRVTSRTSGCETTPTNSSSYARTSKTLDRSTTQYRLAATNLSSSSPLARDVPIARNVSSAAFTPSVSSWLLCRNIVASLLWCHFLTYVYLVQYRVSGLNHLFLKLAILFFEEHQRYFTPMSAVDWCGWLITWRCRDIGTEMKIGYVHQFYHYLSCIVNLYLEAFM